MIERERERERERLKWSYQTSVMLACTGEPIYALNSVYFLYVSKTTSLAQAMFLSLEET
jgi:hypothetical protein